jgi:hypothetical protein
MLISKFHRVRRPVLVSTPELICAENNLRGSRSCWPRFCRGEKEGTMRLIAKVYQHADFSGGYLDLGPGEYPNIHVQPLSFGDKGGELLPTR